MMSDAGDTAVREDNHHQSTTSNTKPKAGENGGNTSCTSAPSAVDAFNFDPASLTAPGNSRPTNGNHFMDMAFAAARDALTHQEVPVGCVFVRGGRLLATGRNTVNETKNATRHAELNCADLVYARCEEAGLSPDSLWAQIDVFVTVEPCVMCAAALIELGVRSVTYGAANQRFGGCGSVVNVPQMMPSSVTFVQDPGRVDEAVGLLKEFYKGENPNAPRPQG
ncbi:tRNA-specific adenosine deaminase 2-like [Amphibalanus amphitrite]|uniref:tRNA-specific adenosine deaminase 2-like n=1 Tax=Amphibalanus amphitrite TaxID=1232801 RepID=UPI001C90FB87|nr:tRNA-specific adenosine deaminase 2-like [Amphibalanus amphitrite]